MNDQTETVETPSSFVPAQLRLAAEIYEERNKLYGDNYKRQGYLFFSLFPSGLDIRTIEEANRLATLNQVLAKITRYCEQFQNGGHEDSLNDLIVYAAMLIELDKKG
jgi:hypothetical protein